MNQLAPCQLQQSHPNLASNLVWTFLLHGANARRVARSTTDSVGRLLRGNPCLPIAEKPSSRYPFQLSSGVLVVYIFRKLRGSSTAEVTTDPGGQKNP